MVILAESPQVVRLPRTSLGYRDDVVHLQVGSLSAHLAGEPIPRQDAGPDGGPVARAVLVPGRSVLPGLPGLVLSAPAIPEGLGGAAGSKTYALGSRQPCTPKVSGPGWVLVWQPGPFAFSDLKPTNLESKKRCLQRHRYLLNREINEKETW